MQQSSINARRQTSHFVAFGKPGQRHGSLEHPHARCIGPSRHLGLKNDGEQSMVGVVVSQLLVHSSSHRPPKNQTHMQIGRRNTSASHVAGVSSSGAGCMVYQGQRAALRMRRHPSLHRRTSPNSQATSCRPNHFRRSHNVLPTKPLPSITYN